MLPSRTRAGLVLAAAVATTGAVYATPAHASPALLRNAVVGHVVHSRSQAANRSLNWAGYVKSGSGITSAAGSWHVPTMKTTYPGYSSTWVGVDGSSSTDAYLIQTGTEADVVSGHAEYHAWWEVITPSDEAPETLFSTLTVHPGDSMRATVAKVATNKWTMTLRDYTTGKTATHTASFAGPGKSAEWIQEDTDVNGYISAAPDWQSVTFSSLTLNGASPALTSSQAMEIYDSKGTREVSTSAPSTTKNGFTTTWLAAGTRTYAG